MAIWRLQTKTSGGAIAKYCIKNGVAAMGWSLINHPDYPNREVFDDLSFEIYCKYAAQMGYSSQSFASVKRLAQDVQENDIIWIRTSGLYYFARVTAESHWRFNNDPEAVRMDACNQLTNIEWICAGDESEVPGALTTAFIQGSTLQRIKMPGICEFSEFVYNRKAVSDFKYPVQIRLTKENFYSLISPSDCEDLLCMWLYKTKDKNYVCIPSTNKTATENYECVLLDAQTGKHIYIQVKNGAVTLDAENYYPDIQDTDNEFYLLTTRGSVLNADKYENIFQVSPAELFEFACCEENQNVLPPNIKFWMAFAGGYRDISGIKGILFDTDSESAEQYMFDNNVVAAWGSPKRYVKSFSKGDYVFYYRKGYGIVAVGKVISEEPRNVESGLEHDVELVVPRAFDGNGSIICVGPAEIKRILKKQFFFASTRKLPYLDARESQIMIDALRGNRFS